uniref:Phospholipase C eta 2 n=1 Tax=Sphenodon punctatus TaxID=8508 RepID=A0A8D0HHN3_SPHPU
GRGRGRTVQLERCMSSMQAGTQMIKLRGSSKGLVRFYYLDEHKSCIRWRPSRKNEKAKITIDSIQEVCEGKQSEIFQRYIIDPFVEVEVIGLPVDCCKEQTRVVDDNGFNPMWEETLVFTVHMPEITLVRFLVWDHDPIGRDFIGQRTIAFASMMPGYRHVYLEGMEEASIFVHVAINDICGKVKQVLGLKGLFHRNPKQASLDSHAAGQLNRKHSFSSHILRRTASAPTKSQKKNKKGFPEIAIDTKDNSSEGASEDRELEDSSYPRFDQEDATFSEIGVATNCMKCMIGSNESPDLECKWSDHSTARPIDKDTPCCDQYSSLTGEEERLELRNWGIKEQPSNGSISSSSSSLESLASPECPKRWSESSRKQAGTLQREMNALFVEKLEEIRSKSPIFFTGKTRFSSPHRPP